MAVICFRLPPDIDAELRRRADAAGVSVSTFLRQLVVASAGPADDGGVCFGDTEQPADGDGPLGDAPLDVVDSEGLSPPRPPDRRAPMTFGVRAADPHPRWEG